MKALDIKKILVERINNEILNHPGEGLKAVSIDMKDPDEVNNMAIVAKSVDEDLYEMYIYFEHIIQFKNSHDTSDSTSIVKFCKRKMK